MVQKDFGLKLPYFIDPRDDPVFPDSLEPDETGLVAVGGNLSEKLLIEAYSKGIFPWIVGPPVLWFSPDPRLVLYPEDFQVPKRLARVLRQDRFSVRFDIDFDKVIYFCAIVPRKEQDGTWIDENIMNAYCSLHEKYLTHCVAVYHDDILCGGLYGLSLGRIFFGESMFSLKSDASKVAFFHLVEWVKKRKFILIDCQVRTEHLLRLGAVEISRPLFHAQLARGLAYPTHNYCWKNEP